MKLFISGSRNISQINKNIFDLLDRAIQNNHSLIIGDADGIDREVQKYIKEKEYKNVIIYHTGIKCRNNEGNWNNFVVETKLKSKNLNFYMQKDIKMAEDADVGLAIWDGKSVGTLNNILNLLSHDKAVSVYLSENEKLFNIKNLNDFKKILKSLNQKNLEYFEKKLKISKLLNSENLPQQQTLNFTH